MKLLFPFFLLGFLSTAIADECGFHAIKARDCSFYYECVEKKISCGDKGYALGYGEHYCKRFNETFDLHREDFSLEAHKWRINTARCLQAELGKTIKSILQAPSYFQSINCREIKNSAFDQHAKCYTQQRYSICKLPPSDLVGIFRHRIIGFSDLLFSVSGITQALKVQAICLDQLRDLPHDERYKWWRNIVSSLKDI